MTVPVLHTKFTENGVTTESDQAVTIHLEYIWALLRTGVNVSLTLVKDTGAVVEYSWPGREAFYAQDES